MAACHQSDRSCTSRINASAYRAGPSGLFDPRRSELDGRRTRESNLERLGFTASGIKLDRHPIARSSAAARGSWNRPRASMAAALTTGLGSPLAAGPTTQTLEVQLPKAGRYQYVCTIHAQMEGDLFADPPKA